MIVAAGSVAGAVIGWLIWSLTREVLGADVFVRQNFRGRRVTTAAGLVVVSTALTVEAVRVIATRAGLDAAPTSAASVATLMAVVGFGLLGLLDDVAGSDDRGFRGHLRVLRRGRLSTGGLKLAGGGLVAMSTSALTADPGVGPLLLDAAVIALSANLGNLFDRAPGRAIKVGALSFAAVAAATLAPVELTGPAVVVGACVALLWPDLRERVMLGDTGSNVLGASVGLAVVIGFGTIGTLVTGAVLMALNGLSEVVSFSVLIGRVRPLRYLDGLGRERVDR